VFNKTVNGVQITVLIYVDDLLLTCKDPRIIYSTIDSLQSKFDSVFKVTEGNIHSYLGMKFDFTTRYACDVTMPAYTTEVLLEAGITGTVVTPAANHLFTVNANAVKLDSAEKNLFHSNVAKLLYLSKRTRADILLPISFLATRVQAPDVDDLAKLNRVYKYLNATSDLGIRLEIGDPDNDDSPPLIDAENSLSINAYIDASHGVHSDFRGHTGTETETIAYSDTASRPIWSRDFLVAQGYKVPPAKIYQDNMSTIALATRGIASSDRTRHVAIRCAWLKDRHDTGEIETIYMPTEDMIADILTKPLQGEQFKRLRSLLLNWTI
jgi:hypothetical protein